MALLAGAAVAAPEVCKLSVCWVSDAARNDYECEASCYFETSPPDVSLGGMCTALAVHEADIPHMYRDTATDTASGVGCTGGCITIGIGNKFESVDDAVALAGSFFIRGADGQLREATESEIRSEFENLPRQPAGCSNANREAQRQCNSAGHYASRTNLTLSEEGRSNLCQGRMANEFLPQLRNIYGQDAWDAMPANVQIALVDMVYNLGAGGLRNNWPNLNRSIRAQDWAAAAGHSNRPQLSAERNAHTRGLFESAARDRTDGAARLARCPV